MRSRSKTALWAVVSMVFFATVSARPLQGGDDKNVAKTDSVAKVDTVDSADPASVVDEVIWVVGDEPILLSDVGNGPYAGRDGRRQVGR